MQIKHKYNFFIQMNIKRENIGLLNELITIELDVSDYQEQVTKSLKDLRRKASLPGFRQGNVPMGIIEKMYKKSVIAEEVSKMVDEEFNNYLSSNELKTIFDPIAAHEDEMKYTFENADDFSFSFEIGLHPEITVNYAEAKKVIDYKIVASPEEIDKEITLMRRQGGKFSSAKNASEQDLLSVTVKPDGDGEEFISILPLSHLKESECLSFVGKNLHDEMDIDTTEIFKSDHERAIFLKVKVNELENAPQKVHITINDIHHIEPAEINDEFFSRLFPDESIKDEAALRNLLKEQIGSRYRNKVDEIFHNNVMGILFEKTIVELPDGFIKRYLIKNRAEYTKENIEEAYEGLRKIIVNQLIENQVAKDCGISVKDEEVRDYIESYVRYTHFREVEELDEELEKKLAAIVQQVMKNQENVKNAYNNIFFDKMIKGLKAKLNPESKEIFYNDFLIEQSDKEEEKTQTEEEEKIKTAEEKQTQTEEEKTQTEEEKKTKTAEEKQTKTKKEEKTKTAEEEPKSAEPKEMEIPPKPKTTRTRVKKENLEKIE